MNNQPNPTLDATPQTFPPNLLFSALAYDRQRQQLNRSRLRFTASGESALYTFYSLARAHAPRA